MLNIYNDQQAGVGNWSVWLDTEDGVKDGKCIGTGPSLIAALKSAKCEIGDVSEELDREIQLAQDAA